MAAITNALKHVWKVNPIIVKEIRSRMRGARAFITLTILLVVMGLAMYGILQIILATSRYSSVVSPQIGQTLFASLAFLELFMICAVTPAVTAGAISGEKEKQTYEMLMATPLSPTAVLWGKLISALSYVLLLLFAAVPMASVVFIFGGVAPRDMLKALLVLLTVAVSYGVLGMFMSALFGRTGRATVASFIAVILLMIGPLFIAVLFSAIRGGEPPRWLLAPSPISALSAALAGSTGSNNGSNLFYILSGVFNMGIAPISKTGIPRPLYHYSIPFYALLSLILYLFAMRLVQPTRRWRLRAKEVLLGVGVLLVAGGMVVGLFLMTANRYELAEPQPGSEPGLTQPGMGPGVVIQQAVPAVPQPVDAAGSSAVATKEAASGGNLTEEAQGQIYAAVARQLFTKDNSFDGKTPQWEGLYLVRLTDDKVGDANGPQSDALLLSSAVIESANKQLNDLNVKVMWIDGDSQAPKDPQTGVLDGGHSAMITFGNIHMNKDGSVQVAASLYFGSTGGTGRTYTLENKNGVWEITGSSGSWIS